MTDESQSIRIAGADECLSIAELHHLCHTNSFASFGDPTWLETRDFNSYIELWCSYLTEQQDIERTWIVSTSNQVIGTLTIMSFTNCSETFRPDSQDSVCDEEIACLRLMYVHPEYSRRGIGSELMELAINYMRTRGFQLATLITHAENKVARQFYELHGWELDAVFTQQVNEFFAEPLSMQKRVRYCLLIDDVGP